MILWMPARLGSEDFGRIDWTIEDDPIVASVWSVIGDAGSFEIVNGDTFDGTSTSLSFKVGAAAPPAVRLKNLVTLTSGRKLPEVVRLPIIDPASAPLVTVEEAKKRLNIDSDDDDADLEGMIETVTAHLEGPDGWLGRSLRPRVLTHVLRRFDDEIDLPYGPLLEVMSVVYLDAAGAEQTLDVARYRRLRSRDAIRAAAGAAWPVALDDPEAVAVTYRAGYDGDLPAPIRTAILLMVGDLYANRESVALGVSAVTIPMPTGVYDLLSPYRRYLV